jgi:DNA-binding NarL/FixJ family response regulator
MTATTEALQGRLPCVLVQGADRSTFGLVSEWLAGEGWRVSESACPGETPALVLVDVPYPRHDGAERLHRIARAHPGAPVIALSPTFFGSVLCTGDCADALGVAGVLPKPVSREALIDGVRKLARR